MDMRVDAAGDDDLAGGVDDAAGTERGQAARRADRRDVLPGNTDIGRLRSGGQDNQAAGYDDVEQLKLLYSGNAEWRTAGVPPACRRDACGPSREGAANAKRSNPRASALATNSSTIRQASEWTIHAVARPSAALAEKVKLFRWGGDCYAYGLLAAGHVDLVVENSLKLYDFAALAPVIKGAGGMITDWKGRELDMRSDGSVLAAGDPAVHRAAATLLTD